MKKTIIVLLFVSSFLTFSSCDTDDEGFYNSEFLNISNLVSIETEDQFVVNDFIYVSANIDNLQPIPNSSSLLDLRKSTNNAPNFDFTYILEKLDGQDWIPVSISPQDVDIISGTAVVGNFVTALATYIPEQTAYRYNAGIQLKTAGQYRLSFGYNSQDRQNVELRSNSTANNLVLNISSKVENLDNTGFYKFTVN